MSLPNVSTASNLYVLTGDLCQYDKDGNIIYVGRKDFRVKIYGQLVEPEAVEKIVIAASDLIKDCVVRKEEVMDSNDEYLSCHLLVKSVIDSEVLIKQIEDYCRQNLPVFMVPVAWKIHSQFPLSPTGKIARKQLGEIPRISSIGQKPDEYVMTLLLLNVRQYYCEIQNKETHKIVIRDAINPMCSVIEKGNLSRYSS